MAANGSAAKPVDNWDPQALLKALYEISYEPRVETKRNRFVNIEGHVDVPSDETNNAEELEREWKSQYIRTKEGRLQIYATHYAGEAPVAEISLNGVEVDANREARTLRVHGGNEKVNFLIRVPSNVFDKWTQALFSHSASTQIDAYVKPIPRAFLHPNERILIVELGRCSIRAGELTTEPSLPQSFFPAIGVEAEDGSVIVGQKAFEPKARNNGKFVRPIEVEGEAYTVNKPVLTACIQKVIKDLKIDAPRYTILISLPLSIPANITGDILTICLNDLKFQGASLTRQSQLVLYSYDVTSGVVVDIGDQVNIIPVIDGYAVDSTITVPYGAAQIAKSLKNTILSKGNSTYTFTDPVEELILRYILEQTTYVPEDYKKEKENDDKKGIISIEAFNPTPEMQVNIEVGPARYQCTEGLFNPSKWGLMTKPLHTLIHEAVQKCPIDSRKNLYRNIYLSGGASLMPGLAEKLEIELAPIVPHIHSQVHISPWRYNAAYLGAQILASEATFSDTCITLKQLPTFLSQLQSD